jgi:DNA polymerase III delta prime subunit
MNNLDNFIWYEKYRPKKLDDMSFPESYKKLFLSYIEQQEIPHLLFFGPPGSGKTTLAYILMRSISSTTMELNASSGDRGIDTMKTKVKSFAASAPILGKIKIIFMDEADKLTSDAQDALRNTIEKYSLNCRFIFTCNNVEKLTKAMRSRFTSLEFSSFPLPDVKTMVYRILESEKIKFSTDDVEKIIKMEYPDIRSIVQNLQKASATSILDLSILSSQSLDIDLLIDNMIHGKVFSLRKQIVSLTDYTPVYKRLFDTFLACSDDEVSCEAKVKIVGLLSEYQYRDISGVNKEINFVACAINLMPILFKIFNSTGKIQFMG